MIDADVGRVSARLHLELDHATAVGGVDTVLRLGSEVDGLMQSVGEIDIAVRWIRWIARFDDLGRVARRRERKLSAAQRIEAPILETQPERQLQRGTEQPGLVGDRNERQDASVITHPQLSRSRPLWEHKDRR
jgi:hypothetical protein